MHEQTKKRFLFDYVQYLGERLAWMLFYTTRTRREKEIHNSLRVFWTLHGKPIAASKQVIYYAWAPGTRKDYVGQTIITLRNRKLKHKDELSECRTRGLV